MASKCASNNKTYLGIHV